MTISKPSVLLAILFLATPSMFGCGDDNSSMDTPDASMQTPDAGALPFGSAADVSEAEQLWTDMGDYTTWSLMPGTAMFEPSAAPHGSFARIFLNDMAAADPTNPAPGSIIVKQNYASETEGDFGAVTVMYKVDGYASEYGDWFWAKFQADGTLDQNPDGVPLAGKIGAGGDMGCIPCHSTADGDDFVFKN